MNQKGWLTQAEDKYLSQQITCDSIKSKDMETQLRKQYLDWKRIISRYYRDRARREANKRPLEENESKEEEMEFIQKEKQEESYLLEEEEWKKWVPHDEYVKTLYVMHAEI